MLCMHISPLQQKKSYIKPCHVRRGLRAMPGGDGELMLNENNVKIGGTCRWWAYSKCQAIMLGLCPR